MLKSGISTLADYAVYTRNPNCLNAAIKGLGTSLKTHLSFAVLDIETDPSVPPAAALVNTYALQDGEVPNWNATFPAAYPSGFPELVTMP